MAVEMACQLPPERVVSGNKSGQDETTGLEARAIISQTVALRIIFVAPYASEQQRENNEQELKGADEVRKPVIAEALGQAVLRAMQSRASHQMLPVRQSESHGIAHDGV